MLGINVKGKVSPGGSPTATTLSRGGCDPVCALRRVKAKVSAVGRCSEGASNHFSR